MQRPLVGSPLHNKIGVKVTGVPKNEIPVANEPGREPFINDPFSHIIFEFDTNDTHRAKDILCDIFDTIGGAKFHFWCVLSMDPMTQCDAGQKM